MRGGDCHPSGMTPQIDTWTVTARPGGWLRLQEPEGDDAVVYLRYRLLGPHDRHRLMLSTIVVTSGDEGLSGRVWRRVPLVKLEHLLAPLTATNLTIPQQRLIDQLRAAFQDAADTEPQLDALVDYFEKGRPIDDLIERMIRETPKIISPRAAKGRKKATPPVTRPPEGRITDEFLEQVAESYRYYSSIGQRPAQEIAEAGGVPVKTVHRWVYEARQRDILPKGRTGRAG